jgi:putrescine aminotransferase
VRARIQRGRRSRHQQARTAQDLSGRAQKLYARHVNPVLVATGSPSNFVKTFVRGEGVHLIDSEGRRYLDFVGGFGSLNLGHNHPAVVEAITNAMRERAPGFAQSAINPFAAHLAEELISVAPSNLEMAFFANSGTEAIEAAVKLARIATGRSGLLHCEGSYHGKSMGALSLAGNVEYRRPFGPLIPDVESVPFGDHHALDRALASKKFAAFVIEPIQAEGGMQVPPAGYLREAQALCQSTGTLLVIDEVQTGLGRTGSLFAVEREGVNPDIMALAKSLGGGLMPIGAMLARRDLWLKAYGNVQTFALHTSTFGGGSLAGAAALATLQALRDEDIVANAQARGEQLYRGMAELCQRFRCLKEVRGRGLLLGLEFSPLAANISAHWKGIDRTGMSQYVVPNLDKMIDTIHVLHAMQTLLQAHGIYTQVARSQPRVLRIEPPLTLTAEHADQFLNALEQTCEEIDFSTGLIDGMIAKTGLGQHNANLRHTEAATSEPHLRG